MSQFATETQGESASHTTGETHNPSASQFTYENQRMPANHEEGENQRTHVNHFGNENQANSVSHFGSETHTTIANQRIEEAPDLRFVVETYYDYQKIRTALMNRVRAFVMEKLGETNDKKEDEDKSLGAKWTDKIIVEKLEQLIEENHGQDKKEIKAMHKTVVQAIIMEKSMNPLMDCFVKEEPIYSDWLLHQKGVGVCMAANLIGFLGYCEKFSTPSKLWAYTGLAVRNGDIQKRKKGELSNWNTKVKTLMYKIATQMLKAKGRWYDLYIQFKTFEQEKNKTPTKVPLEQPNKIKGEVLAKAIGKLKKGTKIKNSNWAKLIKECKAKKQETVLVTLSDGHIHMRAMRKLEKLFLSHYWQVSRGIKGLDCRPLYVVEKLKHTGVIEPFVEDKRGVEDYEPRHI